MDFPTLSVCMIVKNEEKNLERCLASVQHVADEVIVVDTGSADRSAELAAAFGAKIFPFTWQQDFALARNAGLGQATGDWILVMDADEELAPDSRPRLKAALARAQADGLLMVVRNFLPPGPGAVYDDWLHVRLFRNRPEYRFRGKVHEQISPSILDGGGRLGATDLQLLHYGYMEARTQADASRNRRNIALLEQTLASEPGSAYFCAKLGLEYQLAGDSALAEVYLRRVLSLDYQALAVYQFQDVLLALGLITFNRQDYGSALDCALDCLKLQDQGNRAWEARSLLADTHLRLGQQAVEKLSANRAEAEPAQLGLAQQHFEQAQSQLEVLARQADLNPEGLNSVQARLAQCLAMLRVVERPQRTLPPRPDAAARLRALLAAEDLSAALEAHPDWLDDEFLSLVESQGVLARQQGEIELAEGLEALAAHISPQAAGVQAMGARS
jgi:glycosyltransferase involved in cell wall biosynthesis